MFKEPVLDYLPKPYHAVDFGIGMIGAGGIAEIGHIPAYQKAGYHVLAVADVAEKRRQYAQQVLGLGQERVFADHRRLLDLPEIDIVDIALPHSSPHKIPIVHDAIDAGKHVLVEKPLTMDYQVNCPFATAEMPCFPITFAAQAAFCNVTGVAELWKWCS